MGKATIRIPLVSLRPDDAGATFRPRFIPGPRLRKLGFKGEDLRHPDGTWYGLDECAAWSRERTELIKHMEAMTRPGRMKALAAPGKYKTVGQCFVLWFKEPRMNGRKMIDGKKEREPLAAGTVEYYRSHSRRIEEFDDGRIWNAPADAITATILGADETGVLHRIEVERGLHVAKGVRATLSAMYGWAKLKGHVRNNPMLGLDYAMPTPAPRIRYGEPHEIRHLVAAADAIGLPEIGDSFMLGVWTGQRQNDRLALVDGQSIAEGIVFRQQKKHGQRILIPRAPDLEARLAAMRHRRRDWRVNYPHVVLNERTRQPYQRRKYSEMVARARDAAVYGVLKGRLVPSPAALEGTKAEAINAALRAGDWILEPMASLADFHDQDLRDTAVTWLALAGCSKFEVAAITGHSLKTIDEILKHYLGLHPELARSAIAKLVDWYEANQGDEAQ